MNRFKRVCDLYDKAEAPEEIEDLFDPVWSVLIGTAQMRCHKDGVVIWASTKNGLNFYYEKSSI